MGGMTYIFAFTCLLVQQFQHVGAARPRSNHGSLKTAITSSNTTLSGFEVDAAEHPGALLVVGNESQAGVDCGYADFGDKPQSKWQAFKSLFQHSSNRRKCAAVTGQVVCSGKQVNFGQQGELQVMCGKNDVEKIYTKVFSSGSCTVYITSAKWVKGTDCEAKCAPCRFGAVVNTREGNKDVYVQTKWSGNDFGPSVYDHAKAQGSKEIAQTRSLWRRFVENAGMKWAQVRLWMSNHPRIVTVLKITSLILIGVFSGTGIGGVAVATAAAIWGGFSAAVSTQNWIEKLIASKEYPEEARAVCNSIATARWAVGLVFSGGSLLFPFSEELSTTVSSSLSAMSTLDMVGKVTTEEILLHMAAGEAESELRGKAEDKVAGYVKKKMTKYECQKEVEIDFSAAWVVASNTDEEFAKEDTCDGGHATCSLN